jgi:hypothetical protein
MILKIIGALVVAALIATGCNWLLTNVRIMRDRTRPRRGKK